MSGEVLMDAGERGVVHVTLRHAGRLNAMSRGMWRQLREVFQDIQRRSDVRCVLIAGEGDAFCAGGDISEYPGFRFDTAALRDFHENDVWGGLSAMLLCDVPIVAQISGACMGAGVEIASCCDIRIAGGTARFGAPIAKLGFPMAPREAQLVAGAVGDVTARQMLLEAATFSAADMLARGFLSRVVADDRTATEAVGSAQRIAALAPQAARMNKQTFRALKVPVAPAVNAQSAIKDIANDVPDPYAYADSAEHREGITAFLEKRAPVF
ncbi:MULTISPECIES: enoyl-CoA hydratase/isomerase family protein [unclassified Acidovorax]|uniref:enoyl-CoA hydratase/isomerase family protein n=1 Tax=unclassified Acidovorax TaxID=2684926 RepID=UPI001C4665A2|nr:MULTISPECIES: enoyl-CoA hydratase/isomerase family protein [unclassified Acidovorax]MBV7429223.1 enoyl-CoA hydratase/isomerase family protein [Acidovorax sp. sif0732]MBV7451049.1 enoyl-CoA hydratase/isomerase family protein [Acidovorax sp. sif0715]